ncbi:putative transcriptional regulator [Thermobacillus composti KWC4]|uniref:Putative transcriptional regulator n=2 Tax=Thermobacillus TaxID=76632 RepID=L0EHE7_THECK|nr:putative transcriptional regulator [Thermobacillus composti KWC4]
MRRMDRLVAILIALQQRPETAQSLADKFEVSRRTILRDMQALAEMGVPIWAEPGPAGGFRLMEGYRLPPLQLDSQEALTLLFALRALTRLAEEWHWAVRFFYTLGPDAEVMEPERLRREIAGMARQVCERYERHAGRDGHRAGRQEFDGE